MVCFLFSKTTANKILSVLGLLVTPTSLFALALFSTAVTSLNFGTAQKMILNASFSVTKNMNDTFENHIDKDFGLQRVDFCDFSWTLRRALRIVKYSKINYDSISVNIILLSFRSKELKLFTPQTWGRWFGCPSFGAGLLSPHSLLQSHQNCGTIPEMNNLGHFFLVMTWIFHLTVKSNGY